MRFLKANTQVTVTVGPFVDVGDGFTPETGVTLSGADEAELLKHGSSTVIDISGATWTAVTGADGYYSLTLTTSHTDTEGMLMVIVQDDSVCLPVRQEFMVLAEAAYDSLFVAKDTGFMDVNIKALGDAEQSATDLKDFADAGYDPATNKVEGVKLADTTTTNTDMRGTDNAALASALTTHDGKLDTVDANVDSILADTGTDGVLLAATATSAQLVDDVWDEVITGAFHNVNNSGAKYLRDASTSIAATTGTAQSGGATTIQLAVGAVTNDNIFNGERVAIVGGTGLGQSRLITGSTAATDTLTVGHAWTVNPDNTSEYAVMGAEADIRAVAEQAVTATGTVDFDDLAAILADTNELQGDLTNGGRLDLILDELTTQGDTNETKIDTVDANVDAVLVDTGTTIPAQVAGLNDISPADVNAQVVDVLRTDTIPDSVSTDGNQPTIAQAIYMMLQFLTEKEVVGTTVTVKKPDGSTSLMTFTLDDATTPTNITRAS